MSTIVVWLIALVCLAAGFGIGQTMEAQRKLTAASAPVDWIHQAEYYARIGVSAAAQQFPVGENENRFQLAWDFTMDSLERVGIILSPADKARLKIVIESAWAIYKATMNK